MTKNKSYTIKMEFSPAIYTGIHKNKESFNSFCRQAIISNLQLKITKKQNEKIIFLKKELEKIEQILSILSDTKIEKETIKTKKNELNNYSFSFRKIDLKKEISRMNSTKINDQKTCKKYCRLDSKYYQILKKYSDILNITMKELLEILVIKELNFDEKNGVDKQSEIEGKMIYLVNKLMNFITNYIEEQEFIEEEKLVEIVEILMC